MNTEKKILTPFNKMQQFNKAFPEAKDVYRLMQQWHTTNKPKNGVFFPSETLYSVSPQLMRYIARDKVINNFAVMNEYQKSMLNYFWGLAVFGTWRNSLGIYELDEHIFDSLLASPIPEDTPSTIFDRLPEWCIYVAFPADKFITINFKGTGGYLYQSYIKGFWVMADNQNLVKFKAKVLNFHLDLESDVDTVYGNFQPIQLLLGENLTIKQSMTEHARLVNDAYNRSNDLLGVATETESSFKLIVKLLSVLLLLCAEEPDISQINGEPISRDKLRLPRYETNKKTGAFIVPSQPFIYHIGSRFGGELKMMNEKLAQSDSRVSSKKRPHIRKPHWHGVWRGTGQAKEFHTYWQHPIFVNGGKF